MGCRGGSKKLQRATIHNLYAKKTPPFGETQLYSHSLIYFTIKICRFGEGKLFNNCFQEI